MRTRSMRFGICMLLTVAMAVIWLTGCETVREHPRLAAGVMSVAVVSIALSTNHRDYQPAPDIRLPGVPPPALAR